MRSDPFILGVFYRYTFQTYRDSMVTLKMLTDDEVTRIFGKLDCLLPLHEDLLSRFEATRTESGRTESVGDVFIDWVCRRVNKPSRRKSN